MSAKGKAKALVAKAKEEKAKEAPIKEEEKEKARKEEEKAKAKGSAFGVTRLAIFNGISLIGTNPRRQWQNSPQANPVA